MPNLIILATAAFVAGIWCSELIRVEMTVLLVMAATFAGVALWQIKNGPRYIAATILGLFAVAGMLRFQHAETLSGADVSRFAGQTATLYGTVAELPLVRHRRANSAGEVYHCGRGCEHRRTAS